MGDDIKMKNKFEMTREQNIFLAKRNLVDNIYSNAKMEGLNITFPETKTILEGVNVPNLRIDEIQCVLNLRDAWKYVINNIENDNDENNGKKEQQDRKIVYTKYEKKESKINSYDLEVHIPYINIDNEVVKKYNQKIEEIFANKARNILGSENNATTRTEDKKRG